MAARIRTLPDHIPEIARAYLKSIRELGGSNVTASLPPANPSDYPEAVWNEMTRAQQ